MTDRRKAFDAVIAKAREALQDHPDDTRSVAEHLAFVARQRRALAYEIQSAVAEQATGVQYGVSAEDAHALRRLADMAEHEAAVAAWRQAAAPDLAEQIERAEQIHRLDPNDANALAVLQTRPKFRTEADGRWVVRDVPAAAPAWPEGCPPITTTQPTSWDEVLWRFLRARRERSRAERVRRNGATT